MKLTRSALKQAADSNIITEKQANDLWGFIQKLPQQGAEFTVTNVLYYLGGMIAIGAMTLLMNMSWEMFGGLGIFFLCVLYAILGLSLSSFFSQKGYRILAGICATFVICLTPLAIYGLQVGTGWWPDHHVYQDYHRLIGWQWVYMELGTLIVGIILAWIYRYPFMIMPIAFTLWYISMDLTRVLTGGDFDATLSAIVSVYFGLLIIAIAIFVDLRDQEAEDYAYWLYIFGVLAFWCGLSAQSSISELSKLCYCGINVLMMFIGAILVRRVFVVMGALGVTFYLGHLAFTLFKDSMSFPVVLSGFGFLIIYLGILWQRYEPFLIRSVHQLLPTPLQNLLARRHQD